MPASDTLGVQLQQAQLQKRIKVREAVDLWASLYERAVDGDVLLERLGLADKRQAWLMSQERIMDSPEASVPFFGARPLRVSKISFSGGQVAPPRKRGQRGLAASRVSPLGWASSLVLS